MIRDIICSLKAVGSQSQKNCQEESSRGEGEEGAEANESGGG